jgi:hypothetical protein
VAGTCRPYMSSLIYCIQTKYENKQSLLWNLCVLLTYIFVLLRIVKFYMNNYRFIIVVFDHRFFICFNESAYFM